jgi:hypothetical protein
MGSCLAPAVSEYRMTRRRGIIAVLWIVVASAACVRPTFTTRDRVAVVTASLSVTRSTGTTRRAFVSGPSPIPTRPPLPQVLIRYQGGGGVTAYATPPFRGRPTLMFLQEDPFSRVSVMSVPAATESVPEAITAPERVVTMHKMPRCVATSMFLLDGVGDKPGGLVTGVVYQHDSRGENIEWGAESVDPLTHTLRLVPVLQLPSSRRLSLRASDEAFWTLRATWTADAEFLLLAMTSRPEGGYRELVATVPVARELGWNPLPDDGETVIYLLDDRRALHSPCRREAAPS